MNARTINIIRPTMYATIATEPTRQPHASQARESVHERGINRVSFEVHPGRSKPLVATTTDTLATSKSPIKTARDENCYSTISVCDGK